MARHVFGPRPAVPVTQLVALGRVGVPADIAPTIVFLVSDDSSYYNGAELVIDGGLTKRVNY